MTKPRASLFSVPAGKPPQSVPETEGRPEPAPASEAATRRSVTAKTRAGKRSVTAYLDPEAHVALKVLAARETCDIEALVREGLNEVFAKRGLSRIA